MVSALSANAAFLLIIVPQRYNSGTCLCLWCIDEGAGR